MERTDYLLDVPRRTVESSNIKAVGYHKETRTLVIEFLTGDVYCYSPVTAEGHNRLLHADSVGSFFYKEIRNNKSITYKKLF